MNNIKSATLATNNATRQNVISLDIPHMIPIQALSDKSGISYKALWQMCKQNKIVHIKSGNKYLINENKFIEFLNTGEQE